MNNYTYEVRNGIYINLTNRCSNTCEFCIRNNGEGVYGSDSLWLEKEPTSQEVIDELKKYDISKFSEIVFCGYGEPTYCLNEICEISKYIKANYNIKIRINTNGQGNLIHGYDITPRFEGIIDTLSISMNTAAAEEYFKLCKPEFGIGTFNEVLNFGKKASKYVNEIIFSVVDTTIPAEDIALCEKLARENCGILRVRTLD
ncbi:TatD family nuclease-associated radical SAM protein [Eubacteriales bacterium OttesenSCG-928-G02]|nr:TatD family nuclease-associated radical SAM protein [Eubacteriales bacterium OttesenSCG-928-G02]